VEKKEQGQAGTLGCEGTTLSKKIKIGIRDKG
jgi:hypothetical protein